ncbi:alanine-glyoxylate transaminase / serine-glyoxylate transaminase / serine-pyruvate transaminase [Streptomyces sp. 2323.1]|uniref:pyridoxal-phosphate-dependent aminotransferase family protein n=1 Tax=Streptomyces sp. 2323.1 TaxID=1938841 RepID=UPI000BC0CA4B|nr:aminotransferase class V-fold PLP-dependent enzyme [Streptomyces sp. 2323.1]SOE10452.1 alanine-glyoxylate transaminase / serine-glyoxylate transaminase / serine-pyruvate transaminase [Streptomyces sp. 2323.1]
MTQTATRQETSRTSPAARLAMVVGPTRQPASVLERMSTPAPPLTDPDFIAEFGRCLARLRRLVGSASAEVAIVPGSGTHGMESIAASLLQPGVPALVASTGMWGDRWRDICLRHDIPVRAPRFPAGRAPDPELIEKLLARREHQALLVAHVDSSSGVRADLPELARLARKYDALILVDGVSAIGAEQIELDAWDLDVYLGGPPKGLAGPAGLATYAFSRRAVRRLRERAWRPHTYSLDLAPWLPVMAATERGEFGYFQSPAGNLVLGLSEALRLALEEGRAARVGRHRALRDLLHDGLADLGVQLLVTEAADRAYGVTVGEVPQGLGEGELLSAVASEGVLLQAGTFRPMGRSTFRIGHLGSVAEEDITRTIAALRAGLSRFRRGL